MRTSRRRPDLQSSNAQSLQVFCRIKPKDNDAPSCLEALNGTTLRITGSRGGLLKESLHTFTAVFGENDSQDVIFQNVALPLVTELLEGRNGLLLTYGTTGSGKTYVMQGSSKETGILSFSLDVIFNSIGNRQTKKYVIKPDGLNGFDIQSESDAIMDRHRLDYQQRLKVPRGNALIDASCKLHTSLTVDAPSKALYAVFISLVEVYNNNIFDLLSEPAEIGKSLPSRVLREDAQRNVYVSGCAEIEVKSTEDALKIFAAGQKRRRVGLTALNAESSRSHCVFTIRLVRTGFDEKYNEALEDKSLLTVSQLCLVDLAGSERASRAGTYGDRLKEASSINNCLMNLRKCLQVLREIQAAQGPLGLATPGGTPRVVPYRDRRLTHLFKNFFEGNGRVVILVCIRQSSEDYDETMHVLKFAETSQEVSTFRTPARLPPRSPAPVHLRPHYMLPIRDSDRSIASTDTTSSSTTSEQMNSVLLELGSYDREIDQCISRLLAEVGSYESGKNEFVGETEGNENCLSDEGTQDSAPEQDRFARGLRGKRFAWKKIDTEPLRVLITQRMETRKRVWCALECEMAAFRSNLADFVNTDSPQTTTNLSVSEFSDRPKLESHIRWLEGQLVENAEVAKVQMDSQMRQLAEYRSEIESLRAELANSKRARRSKADDGQQERGLRPSIARTNIVSILSRQWERRLAEEQNAACSNKIGARSRPAVDTPMMSCGKRIAAFNPRHRRSRSSGRDGGRWLEHQEITPAPLGTVFSPNLKNRKSVTQLELKDTLKSSNYVLHHQEATVDGNIKTRLYKGPIIPTAGGGSAVIFNDVEELRQTSPASTKRTSDRVDSPPRSKNSSSAEKDHSSRKRVKRRSSSRRQDALHSPYWS